MRFKVGDLVACDVDADYHDTFDDLAHNLIGGKHRAREALLFMVLECRPVGSALKGEAYRCLIAGSTHEFWFNGINLLSADIVD